MIEPDVSIVVVTYKEGLDILKACFDSVASSQNITYELIVVDNGANDATRGLLQSYEGASYFRNEYNAGFAAAVNRGLRVARGRYALLLNPDTRFEPDVIAKMVTHLDEDQNVGVGSCVIRYPDGSLQESMRRFPTWKDQLLVLLKVPHVISRLPAVDRYMMRGADYNVTQDVDSIMGAFMFIRREVLDTVGLLDERYFIWFEEVDYCKMVVDAGWKVRHYADVEIAHHRGHMFAKIATLRKQKWIRRSMRKYFHKHDHWMVSLLFTLLTPVFVMLAYVAALIKRA